MEISTSASPLAPCKRRRLGDRGAHHGARHRIDRRLPRRDRQAGAGHRADALSGAEDDARRPAAPCRTVATTSAPCVTSGSSPASLTTPARAKSVARSSSASAKAGRSPLGSAIVDRIGEGAGEQRLVSGARRGRRAGARRPAAAQNGRARVLLTASRVMAGRHIANARPQKETPEDVRRLLAA